MVTGCRAHLVGCTVDVRCWQQQADATDTDADTDSPNTATVLRPTHMKFSHEDSREEVGEDVRVAFNDTDSDTDTDTDFLARILVRKFHMCRT